MSAKNKDELWNKVIEKSKKESLSQNDLALILGLSSAYVSRLNSDVQTYSNKVKEKLENYLIESYSKADVKSIRIKQNGLNSKEHFERGYKQGYEQAKKDIRKMMKDMEA